MSYFVRKISRAKWSHENIKDNPFDIPSDVISIDLKTQKNTLSVWEVTDESKLDNAVLAIASNGDKLDTIDIVWIEKNEIDQKGVQYVSSEGATPVKDLVNTHFDLSQLNYYKIGLVAESIANKIKIEKIKRYTKAELKKIFNSAVQNGRVAKENLHEGIRKELA